MAAYTMPTGLLRDAKYGMAPVRSCSSSPSSSRCMLSSGNRTSKVTAHATSKSGRPMPLPDEDEDCRNEWRTGGHGLQLNAPRHRPTSSIGTGVTSTTDSHSMILDWRTYRAKLVALERSGAFTPKASSSNSSTSSSCSRDNDRSSRSSGSSSCSSSRHASRQQSSKQPHAPAKQQLPQHQVAAAARQFQPANPKPPAAQQLQPGFCPSSWAHELAEIEVGAVLVARKDNMEFFSRTVLLIAAHNQHGTFGFVLNKPCPLRMCEVQLNNTAAGLADVFGEQRLQLAGPCHMDTLTLLHGYGGLAGAHKVTEDIHYGGLPQAVELVRAGLAAPQDFRLLLGLAGWMPGQLAAEVASGSWHVVSASKDIILPPQGPQRAPDYMWKRILQLIGRPHTQRCA